MDINKHRYYLIQVLLAIFRDQELSRLLAFKGGTSLMLFHNLTRFSTDLDFNLLDPSQADNVYQRLHLRYPLGHTLTEPERYLAGLLIHERLADPRYEPIRSPEADALFAMVEAADEAYVAGGTQKHAASRELQDSHFISLDTKILEYLAAIVEEKDATDEQRKIREINTGNYCVEAPLLFDVLKTLGNNNSQGEYYLTDVLAKLRAMGKKVGGVVTADSEMIMGVNSQDQLAEAEAVMQRRLQERKKKE